MILQFSPKFSKAAAKGSENKDIARVSDYVSADFLHHYCIPAPQKVVRSRISTFRSWSISRSYNSKLRKPMLYMKIISKLRKPMIYMKIIL